MIQSYLDKCPEDNREGYRHGYRLTWSNIDLIHCEDISLHYDLINDLDKLMQDRTKRLKSLEALNLESLRAEFKELSSEVEKIKEQKKSSDDSSNSTTTNVDLTALIAEMNEIKKQVAEMKAAREQEKDSVSTSICVGTSDNPELKPLPSTSNPSDSQ